VSCPVVYPTLLCIPFLLCVLTSVCPVLVMSYPVEYAVLLFFSPDVCYFLLCIMSCLCLNFFVCCLTVRPILLCLLSCYVSSPAVSQLLRACPAVYSILLGIGIAVHSVLLFCSGLMSVLSSCAPEMQMFRGHIKQRNLFLHSSV
jgi:hypothetical protein